MYFSVVYLKSFYSLLLDMKKTIKIFLSIGVLVFTFQFITKPIIHNHKPDLEDHYNCPAYLLNITLASFTFVFFFNFIVKFSKPKYILIQQKISYDSYGSNLLLNNRAPPF